MLRFLIQALHCKRVKEFQKQVNVILPNPIYTTFRRVITLEILNLMQWFIETHNLNHFREVQKTMGYVMKLKSNFMIHHPIKDYPSN